MGLPFDIGNSIGASLDDIATHFKNPKITLVVRSPDLNDGDVVMTSDNLDDAVAAIQRFNAKTTTTD